MINRWPPSADARPSPPRRVEDGTVWVLHAVTGQEPSLAIGSAEALPLPDSLDWWSPDERPQAEAWFRGLLLPPPERVPGHDPPLRVPVLMLRAVRGPLAGSYLRFEADPPLGKTGEARGSCSDFMSHLGPLRRALDFIDYSHLGTWMLDVPSGALDIDATWARALGYSLADLSPFNHSDWAAMTHPDDVAGFEAQEIRDRLARGEVVHFVSRTRHAKGHWVWLLTCCRAALWDGQGAVLRVIGYDIDITEHRSLLAKAEDQRQLMMRILDVIPSGQLVVDDEGLITFCNPVAAELIGTAPERAVGQALTAVLPLEEGPDRLRQVLAEQGDQRGMTLVLRPSPERDLDEAIREQLFDSDTAEAPAQARRYLSAEFTRVSEVGRTFVTLSDNTAQEAQRRSLERAVEQARFIATHDLMTGLPDRYDFLHRLTETLGQSGPLGTPVAVMLIDLDNFKMVNDGMGHEKGDQVIKAAAARLERGLPDRARLARFGGDEFVVMIPDCPPAEAALLAEDLRDRFAVPLTFSLRHVLISCSIGIGVFPQDAGTADELIRCADLAMYEAKALGRGQIRRFTPDLRRRNERRSAVLQAVQRALSESSFHIVLQPKFRLSRLGQPIGAEVLLRLRDTEIGQLSPAEFIPIAEAQGLIPAIDREVVRLVGELRARGFALPLSINLSALTLSGPGFGDLLEALPALARKGGLMVEVTETSFMGRLGAVRDTLHMLRRSGVGVAVDDFGIGHSSLAYLQSLPVQELKIDRSFVASLGHEPGPSHAIVRAILAMAEALGLTTVAEGVETPEQADWLMAHGCELAQGFLLGRPVDPQEFQRFYLSPQEENLPSDLGASR
ncbi:putative bifunctional diguanylate cyclase/phosphodiesterase [Stagnihabitans tardus]|uniref:EAL domain-containing protein n=1 Tax=Stagnihabitans tardus TaxID=2699202 RepID=A0AAE4Y9T8_9RHOB|nr:GGDEF and EAL domain-containing protein [Stagnihabitans tardus]NBZ87752.1 EAL domain-containing protein [Stagnihabitans tardus]